MTLLTVYSKPGCHLCEQAMAVLRRLQAELGFELRSTTSPPTRPSARLFRADPRDRLDGEELFEYFVEETLLRERLESRR